MGGSASEEFLAPTPAGEDTFVECSSCAYAANIEAAEIAPPPQVRDPTPAAQEVDTPGTPTIAALVEWLRSAPQFDGRRFSAGDTLKNLVVKTRAPESSAWNLLVIGVPGDREVDLKRVAAQLEPTAVAVAEPEDLAQHPELVTGLHRAPGAGVARRPLPGRPDGHRRLDVGDRRQPSRAARGRRRAGP